MNRKRIQFNLVVGVCALGLMVLAAYAPRSALAATVASFDAAPGPMSTYCPDVVTTDLVALDRNCGTFAGVWTNCALQVAPVSPKLLTASYTNGAAQSVQVVSLAANPELMAASRYDASSVRSALPATDAAFLAANPELMIARR